LISDTVESEQPSARKRDPEIHLDVRAELSMDDQATRSVEVSVHHGVVSLTGLVDSYAVKWAIDRAVKRIVGVRDLRDNLHVRPPDAAAASDRLIARTARLALVWDARVPNGIRTDVADGVLRLRGEVKRFCQREAAEEAVRNLIGVRDIVNEIALIPAGAPAHLVLEVEAALRRRLGSASRLIFVDAAEGVVTLRGPVPTFAILDDIDCAVRSILGVREIDNQLQVF
jgi:osmotically-inducible protein OsmY